MTDSYGILFVCTGNTCRSPMAEGLLKQKLPADFANNVRVSSAGILGLKSTPATANAVLAMQEKGCDISAHRSHPILEYDMKQHQIVFCMSPHHKDFLNEKFPAYRENVYLLREFAADQKVEKPDIFDPIGGDLKNYRRCRNIISDEIDRILPRLLQLIQASL